MRARRVAALTAWCFLSWVLLTWTATVEVLLVGAAVALACALLLAPLGEVVGPWALLRPRRLVRSVALAWVLAGRVVRANVSMARWIWTGNQRLRTGIVLVPSRLRTEPGIGGTGLLSSLVVDNQVVDVDPSRQEMLYHCVDVPPEEERDETVNGWLEKRLETLR